MKRIIIDIDIQNIIEIVKKRKGRLSAFFANYVIREDTIREEVERRVVDEIQKNLEKNLSIRLHQEGIKARLDVRQSNARD
ncbi:MAG: hypothetical protein R6U28_01200 [Cyclonatronaceae bacterium]